MTEARAADAKLLTFWSGGWVLALAGVVALIIIAWRGYAIYTIERATSPGAPALESFDLSNLAVSRDLLVETGFGVDGLPALDAQLVRLADLPALVEALREQHMGKPIADTEDVIGVEVDGETRAYPLRILTAHEVVNDAVNGRPIVVTYSPLCDSAVIFDRTIDGEVVWFGVSGLLYNNNLVMYDRTQRLPDDRVDGSRAGASLWSQLAFRAISGPRVGQSLEIVPAQVTSWRAWRTAHPDTTVLLPTAFKRYKRVSYSVYESTGVVQYPIAPEPPADGPHPFARVMALHTGDAWRAWLITDGPAAGQELRPTPPGVRAVRAYWFAWHAMHPDTPLATEN